MRGLPAAAALLLVSAPLLHAAAPLPVRLLELAPTIITARPPASFDLIDYRSAEAAARARPPAEVRPHTIFGIKHHVGFGGGYDNGVVHATAGFYVTVAEWGRWNFGIPSPAIGVGRYHVYDPRRRRGVVREESSIFLSLASVHYRAGHLAAWGMNWYVNLEQVLDMRRNMAGSQIGISFSRK
ncbi:MAG: hypothetical protein IT176_09000 [Acidobacteria bacterium]|nr:hypothetical protein [Acidobacteriota bacterium]